MMNCPHDGELRAYLDGEASPVSAAHLESCAACAARLKEMESRANRIAHMMTELGEVPAPVYPRTRASHYWRWSGVAAAIAAALAFWPIGHEPQPPAPPRIAVPPHVAALAAQQPPVVAAVPAAKPRKRKPRPAPGPFLALDNDPIETGFVMRVALDDGVQADVIVDSIGRPRAIRPVNFVTQGERQ